MSIMETVEYAQLEDLWRRGRHLLVVGQPRSGKTSFLLRCTASYYKLKEYVVVRDIGEFFEWFTMLEYGYPIRGLVPTGCRIRYDHPEFEQVEFNPNNLNTLFNSLVRNKINLVFFESFCLEVKNYVMFWTNFFKKLLPWKQKPGHGQKQFCLVMDEFGDIAPGRGRTYVRGQNRLSQLIAMNHRKFRRHNIRLVAAVHYFRDITPPIRERFDCYAVNTNYPNPKEVPFTLQSYHEKFPQLDVDQMIFLDSTKKFNLFTIDEEIPPKRYYDISVTGNVDKLMRKDTEKSRMEKRLAMWKKRSVQVAQMYKDKGGTVEEIAEAWELAPRTVYMHLNHPEYSRSHG